MGKNLPAGAEDGGGYNPWSRTPHTPQSDCARVPPLLSPSAATTEVRALRSCCLFWQQEKPLPWEAQTLQTRATPAHSNQRKPVCGNGDPAQPKIGK